jgi:hypothetical protein
MFRGITQNILTRGKIFCYKFKGKLTDLKKNIFGGSCSITACALEGNKFYRAIYLYM